MIHYGDHTSDLFQKRFFKTLWEAYSLEEVSLLDKILKFQGMVSNVAVFKT